MYEYNRYFVITIYLVPIQEIDNNFINPIVYAEPANLFIWFFK